MFCSLFFEVSNFRYSGQDDGFQTKLAIIVWSIVLYSSVVIVKRVGELKD